MNWATPLLTMVVVTAIVVADAYFLHKRSQRPDFNPWDEI